jgi:hypothetical protein
MINETTKKIKKDKLFLEVNFESYKYLNLWLKKILIIFVIKKDHK